jgi:hypothetical protein
MRFLRTFFLLLCAMLPLTGLAASGLTGECPMQQSMTVDDGSVMSAVMPDCDSMKSSTAGKAKGVFCKATAQCQFSNLYFPAFNATVSHPMVASNRVAFHYAKSVPDRDPNGLWRPPRLA